MDLWVDPHAGLLSDKSVIGKGRRWRTPWLVVTTAVFFGLGQVSAFFFVLFVISAVTTVIVGYRAFRDRQFARSLSRHPRLAAEFEAREPTP